ncbi:Aste57867_527 [Aphanomyces stellatus]|uniref:Aste57867_527 protein n=1 Tax=Aphanomyces stellatus TaxID=120398 RepID=A0A485K314_9STRA|nr:hypothetical protein As57867_000526 [Aphanomyces stellatus]VFT77752.1 Aste57867_527 [Aphanomyces stellatus]
MFVASLVLALFAQTVSADATYCRSLCPPGSLFSGLPGQDSLGLNHALVSASGKSRAVMQVAGNFLYESSDTHTSWASGARGGVRATLQANGELVVAKADGTTAWSSHTASHGHGPYCLTIREHLIWGNGLKIVGSDCDWIWWSGSRPKSTESEAIEASTRNGLINDIFERIASVEDVHTIQDIFERIARTSNPVVVQDIFERIARVQTTSFLNDIFERIARAGMTSEVQTVFEQMAKHPVGAAHGADNIQVNDIFERIANVEEINDIFERIASVEGVQDIFERIAVAKATFEFQDLFDRIASVNATFLVQDIFERIA